MLPECSLFFRQEALSDVSTLIALPPLTIDHVRYAILLCGISPLATRRPFVYVLLAISPWATLCVCVADDVAQGDTLCTYCWRYLYQIGDPLFVLFVCVAQDTSRLPGDIPGDSLALELLLVMRSRRPRWAAWVFARAAADGQTACSTMGSLRNGDQPPASGGLGAPAGDNVSEAAEAAAPVQKVRRIEKLSEELPCNAEVTLHDQLKHCLTQLRAQNQELGHLRQQRDSFERECEQVRQQRDSFEKQLRNLENARDVVGTYLFTEGRVPAGTLRTLRYRPHSARR